MIDEDRPSIDTIGVASHPGVAPHFGVAPHLGVWHGQAAALSGLPVANVQGSSPRANRPERRPARATPSTSTIRHLVVALGLLLTPLLIGCTSSDPATPLHADNDATAMSASLDPAAAPVNRRTRSLDLIVDDPKDEASGDPARLDDAALAAAIISANARVNQLTSQSLHHALDAQGDLNRDATFRKLLLEMKTAEMELTRLEDEQIRRRKSK